MSCKIMNRLCPESPWDKFQPRSFTGPTIQDTVKVSKSLDIGLNLQKKGFHYEALKLWNDKPTKIRELPTLDCFKHQLNTHLKSSTFRNISPGIIHLLMILIILREILNNVFVTLQHNYAIF